MVIASGDHQWRASAEGNGAIDALYRAVDKALAGVLTGHPRLLAYDIHALGEGTDDDRGRDGPDRAAATSAGERGDRRVHRARRAAPNIIAASIEAYIAALNAMLAEAHWAGAAAEAAGNRARSGAPVAVAGSARAARRARRGRGGHDTTAWFERDPGRRRARPLDSGHA